MTGDPGRLLGLDLGRVRIGLALSDPLGITAQPAGVLVRTSHGEDIGRLRALVESEGVVRIVLGHARLLSGAAGAAAQLSEGFAVALRAALAIPVDLWDERLTTAEASRVMIAAGLRRQRRREAIDSVAAALDRKSVV